MEEKKVDVVKEGEGLSEGLVLDRLSEDASGQAYFDVEGMSASLSVEEKDRIKGIIEAVLFTMGDSVEPARLADPFLFPKVVFLCHRLISLPSADSKRGR